MHCKRSNRGLSPRVRGNRTHNINARLALGSIPARAGEPDWRGVNALWQRVYPRACGGTQSTISDAGRISGLSPRVRGNPLTAPRTAAGRGSIPARAGEPIAGPFSASAVAVYPRACGGTGKSRAVRMIMPGLSPRVRGNPLRGISKELNEGSIPARAGEPRSWIPASGWERVYPRACGGTSRASRSPTKSCGLSPRVRGNQIVRVKRRPQNRSIPARAGEPHPIPLSAHSMKVYPRACGGTLNSRSNNIEHEGLSPRVRGNR